MNDQEAHEIMEKISDLFDLKIKEDYFEGFLCPSNNYVYSYVYPCLYVYGQITMKDLGQYTFFGCIRSVDDSGVSFFSPIERHEKAQKRFKSFFQLINEYHPMMPKEEEIKQWAKLNGVTEDKW